MRIWIWFLPFTMMWIQTDLDPNPTFQFDGIRILPLTLFRIWTLQNDPLRLPPFQFDADLDPDPISQNDADPSGSRSASLLVESGIQVLGSRMGSGSQMRNTGAATACTCKIPWTTVRDQQVERGTVQLFHNGREEVTKGARVPVDLLPTSHLDIEGIVWVTSTGHTHIQSCRRDLQ
jgi:hypothetical protein